MTGWTSVVLQNVFASAARIFRQLSPRFETFTANCQEHDVQGCSLRLGSACILPSLPALDGIAANTSRSSRPQKWALVMTQNAIQRFYPDILSTRSEQGAKATSTAMFACSTSVIVCFIFCRATISILSAEGTTIARSRKQPPRGR